MMRRLANLASVSRHLSWGVSMTPSAYHSLSCQRQSVSHSKAADDGPQGKSEKGENTERDVPNDSNEQKGTTARAEETSTPSTADSQQSSSSQSSTTGASPSGGATAARDISPTGSANQVAEAEVEPERWIQTAYKDPDLEPIVDEKGQYIVSKVKWHEGEVAYQTPPPPDKLAPRFGYNVLQVRKDISWWKHYQKYPRFSMAYLNIQFLFLIGAAWLVAFLSTEYRRLTDEMKTPGAMVGQHRGRGPVTQKTQKVSFTQEEMTALIGNAQGNWMDGKGEASYLGSKDYRMKQIARPTEFSTDDFRKR